MNDFTLIMSLLVLGCGIYCLYASYMLKVKGVICSTVLLPKDVNPNKCKDKEGYIKAVYPRVLVLGIVAIVQAIADLFNTYVMTIAMLWGILWVAFLIVLFWVSIGISKAVKRYF